MSASDLHPQGSAPARSAGRAVLIISAILAGMVAVIVAARLVLGGGVALISIALPIAGLAWLTGLGLKMWHAAPPHDAPLPRSERPARRPRRFEPAAGPRADRPSDSGRHVSA